MANILNARWNISADDMSVPNAIDVHIYSAIGFRNLQLYVEYKWNWNEFYAGQAMKIQWGKIEIFQWLSLPLSVAIDWHSSSPILYFFGFLQEFPFSPFIVMALWMGIVIEIYVYVYIIYMTKITDRIVDLGAEWLALLSVCFIGIWVHRFSTEAYIFFISMSHICFTFNRENLVIR